MEKRSRSRLLLSRDGDLVITGEFLSNRDGG